MGSAIVYLGLGSNLGNRRSALTEAMALLSTKMHLRQRSSIYETEPVGHQNQPSFLNAVVEVDTDQEPEEILHFAKQIELQLGRKPTFPNGPRTIDIDLLFYDDRIIDTPDLTVPHPRLSERPFVLVPLLEVAPHLTHPVSGTSIETMLRKTGARGLRKWKGEETDV